MGKRLKNWRTQVNTSWRRLPWPLRSKREVLTYLLVEFGDNNGGELEIPDRVGMNDLIEAANELDVLSAPIDIPSHAGGEGDHTRPKYIAKDVVEQDQGLS